MELAAARKAIVALIGLGGAAAALILNGYDPTFTESAVALAGAVIGAVTVFSTANSGPEDWSKAAQALQAAALSVAGYFTVIPTSSVEQITMLVGAALVVFGVWAARNDTAGAGAGV